MKSSTIDVYNIFDLMMQGVFLKKILFNYITIKLEFQEQM
jgi:hypothetical protein